MEVAMEGGFTNEKNVVFPRTSRSSALLGSCGKGHRFLQWLQAPRFVAAGCCKTILKSCIDSLFELKLLLALQVASANP